MRILFEQQQKRVNKPRKEGNVQLTKQKTMEFNEKQKMRPLAVSILLICRQGESSFEWGSLLLEFIYSPFNSLNISNAENGFLVFK